MSAIVMAQRWMHKHCYRQLLNKLATKRGREKVWVTVKYNPDWNSTKVPYAPDSERAAVDEILRDEQKKRGLR